MYQLIQKISLAGALSLGLAQAETVLVTAELVDNGSVVDTLEFRMDIPDRDELFEEFDSESSLFEATSLTVFSTTDQTTTSFSNFEEGDVSLFYRFLFATEEFPPLANYRLDVLLPDSLSALSGVAPPFEANATTRYETEDEADLPPFDGDATGLVALSPNYEGPGAASFLESFGFVASQTDDNFNIDGDEFQLLVTSFAIVADEESGSGRTRRARGERPVDPERTRRERDERPADPERTRRPRG